MLNYANNSLDADLLVGKVLEEVGAVEALAPVHKRAPHAHFPDLHFLGLELDLVGLAVTVGVSAEIRDSKSTQLNIDT